jgi:uncharacterized protein
LSSHDNAQSADQPGLPDQPVGSIRDRFHAPTAAVMNKSIDHIDDGVRHFLAATSLVVLATTDGGALDASPRGGPPGFIKVLTEHTLAFGDLAGNNRIDTYRNIESNPAIGMLCFVGGLEETLRVNGTAALSADPATCAACSIDGRVPKVAVVVTVAECFIHCGKALRRAGMWKPDTWPRDAAKPWPAAILNDHLQLGIEPALIEADLERAYQLTIWEPGGS